MAKVKNYLKIPKNSPKNLPQIGQFWPQKVHKICIISRNSRLFYANTPSLGTPQKAHQQPFDKERILENSALARAVGFLKS